MPTQTEEIIALAQSIAADIKLLANSKVDQVEGKELSTEDYTTAEKTKLGGLANFDPATLDSQFAAKQDKVTGKGLSTEDYTTPEKTKLAGLVPSDFPTLAIAATMDIGAINSRTISVTAFGGGVAITSLGTAPAGVTRTLVFTALGAGAKSMTHNATSLILPGAINLTLTVGTVVEVVSLGGGNWRATSVTKSNGQAVAATPFAGGTLTAALNEAPMQNITAAETMNIAATTANTWIINAGTEGTEIVNLGTIAAGARRTVVNLASQMVFKNTNLALPNGLDLVFPYGDVVEFLSQGNGAWMCVGYLAASGMLRAGAIQVSQSGVLGGLVDIGPGSSGSGSAPIKLHAGTVMATPETGAFEFDGSDLFFTIAGQRKKFTLT